MSPITYVMKLWTPMFQRSEACGYKSPKPDTELSMLPCRVTTSGPSIAVNVPSTETLLRPAIPVMLTFNWPPSTGVANV